MVDSFFVVCLRANSKFFSTIDRLPLPESSRSHWPEENLPMSSQSWRQGARKDGTCGKTPRTGMFRIHQLEPIPRRTSRGYLLHYISGLSWGTPKSQLP